MYRTHHDSKKAEKKEKALKIVGFKAFALSALCLRSRLGDILQINAVDFGGAAPEIQLPVILHGGQPSGLQP